MVSIQGWFLASPIGKVVRFRRESGSKQGFQKGFLDGGFQKLDQKSCRTKVLSEFFEVSNFALKKMARKNWSESVIHRIP